MPYIVPNRIAGHPRLSDATLSGVSVFDTMSVPDERILLTVCVRCTTLIEGRRTTVRANVINGTGADYWAGVASFGTFHQSLPRTCLLSMSIDL